MSRKSSWWLRPQRKGASNRAALNEAKHIMEHNKVLQERISELAAENAKLRTQLDDVTASLGRVEERNAKLRWLVEDMLSCIEIRAAFGRPPTDEMYETFAKQARELGIEVSE